LICAGGRRIAVVDAGIPAFRQPKPFESLPKRRKARLYFRILLSIGHEHANPLESLGLLRARRERPRGRRSAEERDDEVASSHLLLQAQEKPS
jgi:hypothetical protein